LHITIGFLAALLLSPTCNISFETNSIWMSSSQRSALNWYVCCGQRVRTPLECVFIRHQEKENTSLKKQLLAVGEDIANISRLKAEVRRGEFVVGLH
jgi:hypothetical protein